VGVVVKESPDDRRPKHQVFFEFLDGSFLELYSDSEMSPANLDYGGREGVLRYLPHQKVVFETPSPDTAEDGDLADRGNSAD
jgi:hypothetical protein